MSRMFREEVLPVQATLITRHKFSKPIKLPDSTYQAVPPIISIAIFTGTNKPVEWVEDISPTEACLREVQFKLARIRVTEQKNGKRHIVAVYEEI